MWFFSSICRNSTRGRVTLIQDCCGSAVVLTKLSGPGRQVLAADTCCATTHRQRRLLTAFGRDRSSLQTTGSVDNHSTALHQEFLQLYTKLFKSPKNYLPVKASVQHISFKCGLLGLLCLCVCTLLPFPWQTVQQMLQQRSRLSAVGSYR